MYKYFVLVDEQSITKYKLNNTQKYFKFLQLHQIQIYLYLKKKKNKKKKKKIYQILKKKVQ